MNRNRAHVNSASCIFFSPAAPSEPTPRPAPALGIYSLFLWFGFYNDSGDQVHIHIYGIRDINGMRVYMLDDLGGK